MKIDKIKKQAWWKAYKRYAECPSYTNDELKLTHALVAEEVNVSEAMLARSMFLEGMKEGNK